MIYKIGNCIINLDDVSDIRIESYTTSNDRDKTIYLLSNLVVSFKNGTETTPIRDSNDDETIRCFEDIYKVWSKQ